MILYYFSGWKNASLSMKLKYVRQCLNWIVIGTWRISGKIERRWALWLKPTFTSDYARMIWMLLFEMIMILNVTQRITYPAVWVIGVLHLVLSALADSYLDYNRIFSRIIPNNNVDNNYENNLNWFDIVRGFNIWAPIMSS